MWCYFVMMVFREKTPTVPQKKRDLVPGKFGWAICPVRGRW